MSTTTTVSQYAEGATGIDWLRQVGGDKKSDHIAITGEDNDSIYHYGGKGDSIQSVNGVSNGTKQIT